MVSNAELWFDEEIENGLIAFNDMTDNQRHTIVIISRVSGTDRFSTQAGAYYEHGFHMLARDTQAAAVLKDIVSWIAEQDARGCREQLAK